MNVRFIFQLMKTKQTGQTLIELLVTIGLASILMPAFLTGFYTSRTARPQQERRLQAIGYVREAEEAIRIIRDNGWTSVANGVSIGAASAGTTYCPYQVPGGTTWELLQTPQGSTCDTPAPGFSRSITIADAYRDATTHEIVLIGGVDDPSTKAVTITVSWTNPITSSISQTLYLTRHDNLSYLDTSAADFKAGDTSGGTTVTNIYGGEVQIGGGGSNDWCQPNAAAIVSYKTSSNANEVAISAVSSPVSGSPDYAYTTFGYSANGDTLDKWSVSDPSSGSPVVSNGGLYNPTPQEKSYGVYGMSNAIFIGSNKNGTTVDIIDPSTLTESAVFKDSGGEAGETPAAGTTNNGLEGFVTACTLGGSSCSGSYKLYSFDYHTTPLTTSPRTQDGVVALAGEGKRVVIVNKLAFVATASTSNQLQVFNVSNPGNMTPITLTYTGANGTIANLQGAGVKGATDLVVDSTGTYAYLVTNYVDASHPDIFKIDISQVSPSSGTANVSIVGYANTVRGGVSMSPTGVILVSQNHLIVVGSGGTQYQVFYTLGFSDASYCSTSFGPISGVTSVKAVSSVSEADGDNFAYILTDNASAELQLIPGGQGTGSTGTGTGVFISQGLPLPNLTSNATFNSFAPVADTPTPTSIGFQVAVAPTCAGPFTFLGPNGTSLSTDLYATGSAVPVTTSGGYQNPGECFKYKAYLKSNGSTTSSPILYQVNVNYSP